MSFVLFSLQLVAKVPALFLEPAKFDKTPDQSNSRLAYSVGGKLGGLSMSQIVRTKHMVVQSVSTLDSTASKDLKLSAEIVNLFKLVSTCRCELYPSTKLYLCLNTLFICLSVY